MKQKNDIIRYCAGAAFALQAISWLRSGPYMSVVLIALCYMAIGASFVVIGASFFVKKPVLATVGQVVRLLPMAITFLTCLVDGEFSWMIETGQYWVLIQIFLALAAEIIFLVLTITRKKQLGIAAAVACGIACGIASFGNTSLLFSSPMEGMILSLVGYVLAGFAFEAMPSKASAKALGTTQSSAADKIQRMENLQNLLEKGIITQEEFDEKKKQLLEG